MTKTKRLVKMIEECAKCRAMWAHYKNNPIGVLIITPNQELCDDCKIQAHIYGDDLRVVHYNISGLLI